MILLIDNYDSFTYNLVQRLGEIDPSLDLEVQRNDEITLDEIAAFAPSHLIVSPGPCTPSEAGISCGHRSLRRRNSDPGRLPGASVHRPGHGAEIVRAQRLMHGKTDLIHHDDRGLFAGLQNPLQATRYHSLVIQPGTLRDDFDVCRLVDGPDGSTRDHGHPPPPLSACSGCNFIPRAFSRRRQRYAAHVPGHSPAGRRGPRQVNVYAHGRRSLGPGSRPSGAAASLHPSVGRRGTAPYSPKT